MTSLFRPLAPVAARWRFEDGNGLEHLNLRPSGDTIVADGVIIGNRGGVPRTNEPAESPAGHCVGLGNTGDDEEAIF